MRPSIISTLLLSAFLSIKPSTSHAQTPFIKAGVYHFIDETAAEDYLLSPLIMAGMDVWKRSLVDLRLAAGICPGAIPRNNYASGLMFVPINGTVNYHLPNPGSQIWPTIGMGVSAMWLHRNFKSSNTTKDWVEVGYNATGRLNFPLSNGLLLSLEMTLNLVMPDTGSEYDFSGMMLTAGITFPGKKVKKED